METPRIGSSTPTLEKGRVPAVHINRLVQQLESGETARFDASTVALLNAIEGSESKSAISRGLREKGLLAASYMASTAAGIFSAGKGGEMGKEYVRTKASEYLGDKFLLKVDPSEVLPATPVTSEVPTPELSGWDRFIDGAKEWGHKVVDTVKDVGHDAVQNTKEGINEHFIQPGIDNVSGVAGNIGYVPSAAIGYLVGSAVVGGTLGVYREIRREKSFAPINDVIVKIEAKEKGEPVEGDDPRLELVALFETISKETVAKQEAGKKKPAYSFTRDEWLTFAGAVRHARVSLLREKTAAPQIVGDEALRSGIERQEAVVEGIITTQQSLADADKALAANILSQFDAAMKEEVDPVVRHQAARRHISVRLERYAKTFVQKGLQATGLPLLWKSLRKKRK